MNKTGKVYSHGPHKQGRRPGLSLAVPRRFTTIYYKIIYLSCRDEIHVRRRGSIMTNNVPSGEKKTVTLDGVLRLEGAFLEMIFASYLLSKDNRVVGRPETYGLQHDVLVERSYGYGYYECIYAGF